jgi:hypothetical protein
MKKKSKSRLNKEAKRRREKRGIKAPIQQPNAINLLNKLLGGGQ